MNAPDDHTDFKLTLDDDDNAETEIQSEVDELRIEKLSQRVTLVTILIPVLIVVIVIITYMDIKKRVVHTEDTGTTGVQKLATDLDSRFSSLSLRQAKLEDLLGKQADQINKSDAAVQIKLRKTQSALKRLQDGRDWKKAVASSGQKIRAQIDGLSGELKALNERLNEIDQQILGSLEKMEKGLAQEHRTMASLKSEMADLSAQKVDKEALSLAIQLEVLKVRQAMKEQNQALREQIQAFQKKMDSIDQQLKNESRPSAAPAVVPKPKPSTSSRQTQPAHAKAGNTDGAKIEEQTID